jgi:hypothetical protein
MNYLTLSYVMLHIFQSMVVNGFGFQHAILITNTVEFIPMLGCIVTLGRNI